MLRRMYICALQGDGGGRGVLHTPPTVAICSAQKSLRKINCKIKR
jgi:hypothetical protein